MKRTKRKPTKKAVKIEDLQPEVEKLHFHTDEELLALIRFYAGDIWDIVYAENKHQMRYELIRRAKRMIRLAEELP
jgi:hypothetical protein